MKRIGSVGCVVAVGILLSGCASGLLNNKSSVPQASNVPSGTNLAMPPDLSLPAPGTAPRTAAAPVDQATVDQGGVYDTASAGAGAAAPINRSGGNLRQNCPSGAVTSDVYECYGIARTKPNGTAKTEAELKAELKAAVIAEKRRTDPGYGTVRNIGAIFRDD